MPLPVDTRRKVLAALERGEGAKSIATRFEIGERSVYRLQARHRNGLPIEPGQPRRTGSFKLTVDDEKLLLDAVAQAPSVTAAQVLPRLSVKVDQSTVCRAWIRLGLTRKKRR